MACCKLPSTTALASPRRPIQPQSTSHVISAYARAHINATTAGSQLIIVFHDIVPSLTSCCLILCNHPSCLFVRPCAIRAPATTAWGAAAV